MILTKIKLWLSPCKRNNYKPFILNNNFLFYYALVLLFLKLIIIPFFLYFPQTSFFADLTQISLVEQTNQARVSLGLKPLQENSTLSQAAYLKAQDMIEGDYFGHYSPEGISPWFWLKKTNYNYQYAGENLAIGFLSSEQVHRSWMNSPSHKENILNENYEEIGIAVLKDNFQGKQTTLVVQYFGNPQGNTSDNLVKIEDKIEEPEPEEKVGGSETEDPEIEDKIEPEPEEKVGGSETEDPETEDPGIEDKNEKEELERRIFVAGAQQISQEPILGVLEFMTTNYYNLVQDIVYVSLIFFIFLLFITFFCDIFIYHKFVIKHKDIIYKKVILLLFWAFLMLLDQLIIVQLLAYNFRIN